MNLISTIIVFSVVIYLQGEFYEHNPILEDFQLTNFNRLPR
jgi:hypothetical protein